MKWRKTTIWLALTGSIWAQERMPQWIVYNNPLALLQGQVPGAGELVLIAERHWGNGESTWLGGGFSYLTTLGQLVWHTALQTAAQTPTTIELEQGWGFRLLGGYRYYPGSNGNQCAGWHMGPLVSYHRFWLPVTYGQQPLMIRYTIINFIFAVGYQLQWKRWRLDAIIGYNYRFHRFHVYHRTFPSVYQEDGFNGHWFWMTGYLGWVASYIAPP